MHAFLFVGGTKDQRQIAIEKKLTEWAISSFDRITLTGELASIGISQIRDLTHRLLLAPYQSPWSVAVITCAEKMTYPAQHALLKTLEEPPLHARIILESATPEALLPTILSRCQLVDLGTAAEYSNEEMVAFLEALRKLSRLAPGQRLKSIETLVKTREDGIHFIEIAIAALQKAMLASYREVLPKNDIPTLSYTRLLRKILVARGELGANVNVRLAIDNALLSAL